MASKTLASDRFDGALWLEGTPTVEETAWWLNLLIDTTLPIAAVSSQRAHGALGNDGDRNIVDAATYLTSRVWADEAGRDALGVVAVLDQRVLTVRSMQKADARPGGYIVTGGHGGVFGTIVGSGPPVLSYRPVHRHTWSSEVRLTALPERVPGTGRSPDGRLEQVEVAVRDHDGALVPDAIPIVSIVKRGSYAEHGPIVDAEHEMEILGLVDRALSRHPLAGLVAEGLAPYGTINELGEAALLRGTFSGLPVVKVGRGNADGVTESRSAPYAIAGGNLSATKARLLLMACLLRFGALTPAADPARPTRAERAVVDAELDRFRAVFASH